MATVIKLEETELDLAGVYDRAAKGEEIVLARADGPNMKLVVELTERPAVKREFGTLKGKIKLDDSFFDPLPEEELRLWEGG